MVEISTKGIRLIAFDFDGVFTDGKVIFSQDGTESIVCSRKDSLGINFLKDKGIGVIVISKETNPVVIKRCEKMGVECFHGIDDKLSFLKKLLASHGIRKQEVCYVGDDLNDLECLEFAGLAITVADGARELKAVADYVTSRNGGDHAVREIADLFVND
jgi:YrbI family 3-deoxy-D-manno-octulosonate 8-phosphate phosphatase